MKNKLLSSFHRHLPAPGLLLGCALLLGASASGQNLLKNGDFESPFDPWDPTGLTGGNTNWTLVYVSGGPGDFAMHDRSTYASRHAANGPNGHGANLRPSTEWWCHAYFTQTVSNLTAGASYVLSGYVNSVWGKDNGNLHVYAELLGGPSGTTSAVTPDIVSNSWSYVYSVTNTASSSGTVVVRLHENKGAMANDGIGTEKYFGMDAFFDDFTLTAQ